MVIQLQPGDNLNVFLCVRWQSNIQCLSQKTHFLGFLFRKVVQNH